MKKKVSPKVKEIITQSRVEALRLGHDYISTEHLLLGIVNEPDIFASKVLVSLGVDIKGLISVIGDNSSKGKSGNPELKLGELPLNRHAEKALKVMSLEAKVLKNDEVRPEHLLLAILKYPESIGAKILNNLDVDYEKYKTEIEHARQSMQAEAPQDTAEDKDLPTDSPLDNDNPYEKNAPKPPTSPLSRFGRDITQYVNENRQYATVEREAEIRQITQILSKRENNNVLLIGEPGVGKRAIVEEFAHRIQKDIIYRRRYKRIIELDWTKLLADTGYRGAAEKRIKAILYELEKFPQTILLLNQMHVVYEKFNGNGLNIIEILKHSLKYGELKLIGIIAADKYPSLMIDRTMNNYFHKLFIQSPSPKQAILMLESAKSKYEAFHNVSYGKDVIETCVQLTHLRGGILPGKAVDLLDEVAAQVRLNNVGDVPDSITELEQKIETLKEKKNQAVKSEKYEYAADLRDEEAKLIIELEFNERRWLAKLESTHLTIEKKDVEELFASIKKFQQPEKE